MSEENAISGAELRRALDEQKRMQEHERNKQPVPTIGEQARQALGEMLGVPPESVTFAGSLSPADEVFVEHLDAMLSLIRWTLISKRHDYGTDNLTRFGEFGVLVRTFDKLYRLDNLLTAETVPANEPIADTWLDVAGYGILGLILHQHGIEGIKGNG